MARFRSFEEIDAWKLACRLAMQIYSITRTAKFARDRALCDQLRRSAISIPSNIAEGFERESRKDFRRYLLIAKGSAGELRTQLHLTRQLGYVQETKLRDIVDMAKHVSAQLANLIKHLDKKPEWE